MTDIKHFLEWIDHKQIIHIGGNTWKKVKSSGNEEFFGTDYLQNLYESETRQYSIGDVWDMTLDVADLLTYKWLDDISDELKTKITAFAERYHQLKSEGRIKQ